MKRRNLIKYLMALPVIGFIPELLGKTLPAMNIPTWDFRNVENFYLQGHPKTCSELVEWMEKTLPVGEPTAGKWSVTGEEYKEAVIGLVKPRKASEERLCRFQWQAFLKECRSNAGPLKLYWRVKPEYVEYIDLFTKAKTGRAKIYMRYHVSGKKEI